MSNKLRLSDWLTSLESENPTVMLVAEMANAHEGELDLAKEIAKAAVSAGADGFKVQCFFAEELLVAHHPSFNIFRKLEMSTSEWQELIGFCHECDLDVWADVFGTQSAALMHELGVDGFKIHASDVPNNALLHQVGSYEKPVLLSAGGATWLEICEANNKLRQAGATDIIAVYGVQRFPTALEDSCINKLALLKEKTGLPIGYADHIAGGTQAASWLPLMAIGAGAIFIEKHITLDRTQKGTDYYSSMEPNEFADLAQAVREAQAALGAQQLALSEAEKIYRHDMKKQPVAAFPLKAGTMLARDHIIFKRVPGDAELVSVSDLLGKRLTKDMDKEAPITLQDVKLKVVATLACRAGSKRLYAKPLQRIGDKMIIEHLIERLQQIKQLDEIVLAISEGEENRAFVQFAKDLGLPYVIGNEKDVLGRLIKAGQHVQGDLLLRVTTENPFVYYNNMDELICHHKAVGAAITVCECLPNGTHIEVISRSALEYAHAYGEDRHRSELCTLFIFENPDLFKIEKIMAPAEVRYPEFRLTVDTPEDLLVAQTVYNNVPKTENDLPALTDIVSFLAEHPEVRQINEHNHTMKLWR